MGTPPGAEWLAATEVAYIRVLFQQTVPVMTTPTLQNKTFALLLVAVSLAFGAILWPYYEAVFWGVALAILFMPVHRRMLARMPGKPNRAALATLVLCLVVVILPLALIGISLIQEATHIYERLRSGQLNFGAYLEQVIAALPAWLVGMLDKMELTSVAALQHKLSSLSVQVGQVIATQALNIGQNTLQFAVGFGVMLYLLFFLLRDGPALGKRIHRAIPLQEQHKRDLLGGFIFWVLGIQAPVLWGVLMAFLSLLPAVGAGLIWGPVAIYFLATGALWQAGVLTAFGVGVIGLVDNLLRPLLVGKDTKMPDYVVLISTLGGMTLFGINGFVIGPVIAALFMACWDLATPKAA